MMLLDIARQAIAACAGEPRCQAAAAELDVGGRRVHLVGAGKAAGQMARGVAAGLPATLRSGLVVTKDEHFEGFSLAGVEVRFASHPEPDARSVSAAGAIIERLSACAPDDLVVAVLSGGASSLLASPAADMSLDELAAATRALLGGGVGIDDMNIVRRHLTRASGGRLAQRCAAAIEVLLISDVLGDDLSAIGSGPFAPDASTFADALEVARAVSGIPRRALLVLEQGARGDRLETPEPGEACFERVGHQLLASHATLLKAARKAAKKAGYQQIRTLRAASGDVEQVAAELGAAAADLEPGELLIGGGEPTVRLPPDAGRGGRNQQLALLLARAVAGERPLAFLAVGSDGSDGPTDAAGALVDNDSYAKLCAHGDPDAAIARADAYPLLDAAGMLIRTGSTGTNVLDLHLLEAPIS